MSGGSSEPGIQCPIGLFARQEAEIERLSEAMNAAATAWQKVPFARELIEEAGVLLACASRDPANHNCRLCRSITTLRLQTANLIVDVGERVAAG